MGAVQSPFGARKVPPQPFARPAGRAAEARARLLALRTEMMRHLPVLWQRARNLSDRHRWAGRMAGTAAAGLQRIGEAVEAASFRAVKAAVRAIEWRRVALVASSPFVLPAEFRGAMVRILAYLGAIGAMSLIAAEMFKQQDFVATAEPLPPPAWIEIERPWPAFQLSQSDIGEDDTHYAIRRHAAGGGRKDTLSFGELGKTQRYMNFEIYRAGHETIVFDSAAGSMRDIAGDLGRVTGMRSAMPIPSKFGKFQAFEFAIGPFSGYNCVGFIRTFDGPQVRIGGLSCNMKLLVDRAAISCALDRLTLMSAGSAPDLARLFARAELKRSFCGQRDHLLYATPKRGGDVASASEPKPRLRGRFVR